MLKALRNDVPANAIITLGAINNPTQKLGWKYFWVDHITYDEVTNVVTVWPGEEDHESQ